MVGDLVCGFGRARKIRLFGFGVFFFEREGDSIGIRGGEVGGVGGDSVDSRGFRGSEIRLVRGR